MTVLKSRRLELGTLYPFLAAIALVGYPLISFLPAYFEVSSRTVTVPFRGVVVTLAVLSFLFATRTRRLYRGLLWLAWIPFWLLYSIRIALDTAIAPVDLSRPSTDYLLYAIGTCALSSLGFFRPLSPKQNVAAARLVLWVASLACILALLYNAQRFGQNFGRAYGNELLNPITLGHVGVTVVILTTLRLFQANRVVVRVIPTLLGIGMGLAALALSSSRGPLLALVFALLLIGTAAVRSGHRVRAVVGLVGVIAAVPYAIAFAARMGSSLFARLARTQDRMRGGGEARLDLWKNALDQFFAHPLLGSGLEEKVSGTYPHNIVIEAFMATGVVGGICVVVLILAGLRASLRLVWDARDSAWIAVLYVQNLVWALFSGAIYTRPEFWYLVALVVTVDRARSTVPLRCRLQRAGSPGAAWRLGDRAPATEAPA